MIQEKKCKGSGQANGYGCGKLTNVNYRKYGLCKSCYPEWLFSSDAGKVKMAKAINKVQKPRKDFEKAKTQNKIISSLENLKQSVKNVCHQYIRLRDKYKNCISCGAIWNEHYQAGHFYKAELYSNLKYHPKNINGQCRICNLHKDGNFEGYRKGFLERYGLTELNKLDKLATSYKAENFKWDRELLKEDRAVYNGLLKELKENQP